MRIPPYIVDEIYRRADILEIVSEYVQLKRKGSYYVGLSPFKQERTPSFTVTPSKGIYKCFSTGKGGTVVNFLMEIEGLSYREALLKLAERYQIDVEWLNEPEQISERDRSESLYILNEFAAEWYQKQLWESEPGQREGLKFLRNRGLSDETIRLWQLGYSPNEWDAFTRVALESNFTQEALLETGLSFRSEKTGQLLDRFRGRLMFPIRNGWGKLCGFGARQLRTEDQGGKYINSRDSLIYNKSQLLYGLHTARESIRQQGLFILVEGYLDALALHQAGYNWTVASCGTSLTSDQIHPLKRICQNVVILYDSDSAGQAAAIKAAEIALAQGFEVEILTLPDSHDPDSFLRELGIAEFSHQWSTKRKNLIEWLLQGIEETGPAERVTRIQDAAKLLSAIPDSLTRSVYTQELARLSHLPEELVQQTMQAFRATERNITRIASANVENNKQLPRPYQIDPRKPSWFKERELLRLLLNYYSELVNPVDDCLESESEETALLGFALKQHLADFNFADETHEAIRKLVLSNFDDQGNPRQTLTALFDEAPADVQQVIAELMSQKYVLSERFQAENILVPELDQNLQQSFEEAICYYALQRIHELEAANIDALKAAEANSDDPALLNKLLNRHRLLNKKRELFTSRKGIVVTAYKKQNQA